jgi:hypothetical protein
VEYHVLKDGGMSGPYSEEELRSGVAEGRFAMTDFVQVDGQVAWVPIGQVLGTPEEVSNETEVPGWRSILKWAWMRLRHDVTERGLATGSVCLLLGLLALALSKWPVFFWMPWLLVAAITAFLLLRRGREVSGALLLLAVVAAPWLTHYYLPRMHLRKAEPVAQTEPAEVSKPAVRPGDAAAPDPIPAPSVARQVSATSAPAIAATKPALATPAPESLLTTAGKLAEVVAPFLNRAKEAPKAPDSSDSPMQAEPVAAAANGGPAALAPSDLEALLNHNDPFVILKGTNGSCNGFICRLADKAWLFSTIELATRIKQPTFVQLDGVPVTPGPAEIAAGPDIVRYAVPKPPAHPLEAMQNLEANLHIGDSIRVLGNKGGGVITPMGGEVIGIGPDRVEITLKFIPGVSGSPIVHVKTGKVIGIASYNPRPYDEYGEVGQAGNTALMRRFGWRIDHVPAWEPVNWPELYAESDQLAQISKVTEDQYNFFGAARDQREPKILTEALRGPGMEWYEKMHKKQSSEADRGSAGRSFLNTLHFLSRADITPVVGHLRYTYFRNELAAEQTIRDRIYKAFEQQVASNGPKPH